MLTKEKLLASIKAMPEDEFEDIDVLLERIVILGKLKKEKKIFWKEKFTQPTTQGKSLKNG